MGGRAGLCHRECVIDDSWSDLTKLGLVYIMN
jgi:hypothetical protein